MMQSMERNDAIEGIILKWQIGYITHDKHAMLCPDPLARFSESDEGNIQTNPVLVCAGIGQVFGVLDRARTRVEQIFARLVEMAIDPQMAFMDVGT